MRNGRTKRRTKRIQVLPSPRTKELGSRTREDRGEVPAKASRLSRNTRSAIDRGTRERRRRETRNRTKKRENAPRVRARRKRRNLQLPSLSLGFGNGSGGKMGGLDVGSTVGLRKVSTGVGSPSGFRNLLNLPAPPSLRSPTNATKGNSSGGSTKDHGRERANSSGERKGRERRRKGTRRINKQRKRLPVSLSKVEGRRFKVDWVRRSKREEKNDGKMIRAQVLTSFPGNPVS